MSTKCLITNLNTVVDNDSLLKVGESCAFFTDKGSVNIAFSQDTKMRILGGYFSDSSYANNIGTEVTASALKFYYIVPTSPFAKLIFNRQYVTAISFNNCEFDIEQLYYMPSLISPGCGENVNSNTILDINKLCSKLSYIQTFQFASEVVKGDISAFANFTPTWIRLGGRNVIGDIQNFKGNIDQLFLSGTNIGGELSSLKCKDTQLYNNGTFTWKESRPSSYTILSFIGNANLGDDADNLLIDQATHEAGEESRKTIAFIGNRTSASDEAIATLQSKGYTVSVSAS